jgi:long-chain acyl-CoA synthetase
LTETGAASFIASADVINHTATVGPPTPCTELKLESVPEMNYDALDKDEPKGEVLIRSPANFSGYFKDQKKTDEELTKDGWFHTGG